MAKTGHMTRAAVELGIQQPPLSRQIRALEAPLGLPLFHRPPKGMALTEGGRLLLEEATRILDDVAAAETRLRRVAHFVALARRLSTGQSPRAGQDV